MNAIYEQLLAEDALPRFAEVEYDIEGGGIADAAAAVREALERRGVLGRVRPGMRVAVTAGSREINHMREILREVIAGVRRAGGEPFVVPAMGSHGGATAEGQREILRGYGLTEASLGCPIRSSMETVRIGASASGHPVYIDRNASEADGIVVVGRVKPHTDFRGRVESGLMKMMTIGLGKQYGAMTCHRLGYENMAQNVWEFGNAILRNAKVLFGVSIIEDFYHETYRIDAIPAERIPEEEPELLRIAKSLIPGIPFERIDALYVQEIGKDISGSGMDPNVTGRSALLGTWKPFAQMLVVLDVTEKSHGNATGIGLADVTTRRVLEKFDPETIYPNCITSCDVSGARIPPVMPNDELALRMARHLATRMDPEIGYRAVWIKNTSAMRRFYISEALIPEAAANPQIRLRSAPEPLEFDAEGNLAGRYWRSRCQEG